ncbi:MAG: dockerin type I domain-containing protein [Ruminococcus sp.]|nr:dockerin type I domain-containing protein [Ruminococcus sp.]
MKTLLKKPLAVILSAVLLLTAVHFSASAAGAAEQAAGEKRGTITVTSNFSEPVYVDYDYYNDTVTVTYSLQSPHSIVCTQAYVEYDSSVLELGNIDLDENLPQLNKGSGILNTAIENYVYFNASKINFYNFKTSKVFYTQTFNIIGTGDTTVKLTVDVLTGSDQADYTNANMSNDIFLIDFDRYMENQFTFTASAQVSGEEPATVEPTEPATDEPTEPATDEPTEPATEEPTEPTVEPTEPPAPEHITGDVNGDGIINGKDAAFLARYTSGWDGYADKVNLDAADINGDGKVNGMDSAILMRYTSGWDGYSKYFT